MRPILLLPVLALAACAPRTAAPPSPSAPVPDAVAAEPSRLPNEIHWVRNSAEHRAVLLQIYRQASDAARVLAADQTRGAWAVIMDADETVLDNSEFQKRLVLDRATYSEERWNAWVRETAAPALPGAHGFIRLVRELGGRVVIVTNREESVCEPTRENLREQDLPVDLVLCKRETSDKNPRFSAVAGGTAAPALPPLRVLMWVGDNIQDFPALRQDSRTADARAFDAFGRTYFVIPNPMYGSWERNPGN